MATEIVLGVVDEGSDELRLEEFALSLRSELLQLDGVKSVEQLATGEAPEGTRSALVVAAGALITTLTPTHLSGMVHAVVDWLGRSGTSRAVRIEIDGDVIDLKGVSDETQLMLVDHWLSRHAASS